MIVTKPLCWSAREYPEKFHCNLVSSCQDSLLWTRVDHTGEMAAQKDRQKGQMNQHHYSWIWDSESLIQCHLSKWIANEVIYIIFGLGVFFKSCPLSKYMFCLVFLASDVWASLCSLSLTPEGCFHLLRGNTSLWVCFITRPAQCHFLLVGRGFSSIWILHTKELTGLCGT